MSVWPSITMVTTACEPIAQQGQADPVKPTCAPACLATPPHMSMTTSITPTSSCHSALHGAQQTSGPAEGMTNEYSYASTTRPGSEGKRGKTKLRERQESTEGEAVVRSRAEAEGEDGISKIQVLQMLVHLTMGQRQSRTKIHPLPTEQDTSEQQRKKNKEPVLPINYFKMADLLCFVQRRTSDDHSGSRGR
ncbi:hypothetical protein P4O66_020062 [Electrophorus voltai]|uniref:Uncharacterized protein n=1 Tax=Electrophorus voltai TaxID=2609070 RepID=A0AAD9E2J3_9TELE|nr:hypothetical protein P4O66_020062 [Electrophorus voltai]